MQQIQGLEQWGFVEGRSDWTYLEIQQEKAEIYSQGASVGMNGWEITKRHHQG